MHHIYIKNDTAVASDVAQLSESSALQTNGVNERVSQPNIDVKDKYSRQLNKTTEIADIIENVLSEVSQGKTNVQDAVTRLTAIQENVLQNGYEIEYEPRAKEFRKELRYKPIYLTARDYNQLYILVNLKRIEAGVSKAGKNNPRNTFRPASENGISKAVEPESPETPFARFPSLDYQTAFILSTHC